MYASIHSSKHNIQVQRSPIEHLAVAVNSSPLSGTLLIRHTVLSDLFRLLRTGEPSEPGRPYCRGLDVIIDFRSGMAPDSLPEASGVCAPAGVPTPENGLTVPLGGCGICRSSGLPGTSF